MNIIVHCYGLKEHREPASESQAYLYGQYSILGTRVGSRGLNQAARHGRILQAIEHHPQALRLIIRSPQR